MKLIIATKTLLISCYSSSLMLDWNSCSFESANKNLKIALVLRDKFRIVTSFVQLIDYSKSVF